MDKEEVDKMIEAHREAAWRHGFLCGFAWAALAVIIAAVICSTWVITLAQKEVVTQEKKK